MTTKEISEASEDLLTAWLTASSLIRNERMVEAMTFREISVCNILYRNPDKSVTATDVIAATGMLKSQVNKVLTDMESKQLIVRTRATDDKRKILIAFTDRGHNAYEHEHNKIKKMLEAVVNKLGTEKAEHFSETMVEIVKIIDLAGKEGFETE